MLAEIRIDQAPRVEFPLMINIWELVPPNGVTRLDVRLEE